MKTRIQPIHSLSLILSPRTSAEASTANTDSKLIRHIVRSHHEKYDGGGYPDGLKGDDIPVEAQLISIADTYDALVNDRIYKKAYPKDVAFNMINVGECGVFPPKMLECFKECREQLEAWENGELSLGIR